MSDGSAEIRVWDSTTFSERSQIRVHDGNRAIESL